MKWASQGPWGKSSDRGPGGSCRFGGACLLRVCLSVTGGWTRSRAFTEVKGGQPDLVSASLPAACLLSPTPGEDLWTHRLQASSCGSCVKVALSCPTLCDPMDCTVRGILQARILEWVVKSFSRVRLCDPMDCSLPGSSVHGIFLAVVLEWIAISFSRGIFPTQGSNPGLPPCRQMLYCLSHQGSPAGVGSLSLIQGIFPTRKSNPGLLHCGQILYQLSHNGSPGILE